MEGLFRQIGIFNQQGQLYEPVDKDQVMYYREDKAGQILQEGINEAGGMSSWIAAATSYSTNNRVMIPFYTYYSMFGCSVSATWPGLLATCAPAASCWAAPPAVPR
jgi:pyruvate dehydrogenase E1 component